MPLLETGARFAARRMPKVIPPGSHAVLDYLVAGAFLLMGARMWKRHRRAAVGAVICGGATALNAMLTEYPGGVAPLYDFQTHGRIDATVAAMTASAPKFLGFSDEAEARFFSVQALVETVVAGLTDYEYDEGEAPAGE